MALPDTRPGKASRSRAPLIGILRTKSFVLFLAAAALVQGSHAVYYAFGTLHWRAAGHSDTVIGLLWAEGVIAEIALFAVGAWVLRVLSPAALIALGGAAGALRWAVTGASSDLPVLFVMQGPARLHLRGGASGCHSLRRPRRARIGIGDGAEPLFGGEHSSPLKKALLTGFHSTAKHIAAKAVSPSSETMRTI